MALWKGHKWSKEEIAAQRAYDALKDRDGGTELQLKLAREVVSTARARLGDAFNQALASHGGMAEELDKIARGQHRLVRDSVSSRAARFVLHDASPSAVQDSDEKYAAPQGSSARLTLMSTSRGPVLFQCLQCAHHVLYCSTSWHLLIGAN